MAYRTAARFELPSVDLRHERPEPPPRPSAASPDPQELAQLLTWGDESPTCPGLAEGGA